MEMLTRALRPLAVAAVAVLAALPAAGQEPQAASSAAPNAPRVVSGSNESYEAVLKYPPVSAGGEMSGRLYLSEFATNRPISGARVRLTVPETGARFEARSTSSAGTYALPLRFPRDGRYQAGLEVRHERVADPYVRLETLAVGRVPGGVPGSAESRQLALTLLLLTLLVVGIAGWFYLKRSDENGDFALGGDER
jgi:hypothetical protein